MAVNVSLKKGRYGPVKDFFISYTSSDKAWAEWIAWELETAGYTTVIQAWDFLPGQNFVRNMDNASKNSERTIAVLSSDYFNATFTLSEWTAAFWQDPKGEKGILLPVMVRECNKQLMGLLGPIAYINLVGEKEAKAREILLESVKKQPRSATPPSPPSFPEP